MNFFMIVGPQAVGKMTVGQELAKLTDAKLFHNHMTIDLVSNFFDYGSPEGMELVQQYRKLLLDKVISSANYSGFIFTLVCDFNSSDDLYYVYDICNAFEQGQHTSYIIELNADYTIRKERNITENRVNHKQLKRNIVESEKIFEHIEKTLRTSSYNGEIKWSRYIKIDNSYLSPNEVAKQILDIFCII